MCVLLPLSAADKKVTVTTNGKESTMSTSDIFNTTFNKPGDFSLFASLGYNYLEFVSPYTYTYTSGASYDGTWHIYAKTVNLQAGAEYILAKLDIKDFPLELGLSARGGLGYYTSYYYWSVSGFMWNAAAYATLHKGLNFGQDLHFDVELGLGAGLFGTSITSDYSTQYSFTPEVGGGFATLFNLTWELDKNLWLGAEEQVLIGTSANASALSSYSGVYLRYTL